MATASNSITEISERDQVENCVVGDRFFFDCDNLIMFCSGFEKVEIQDQTESILEVRLEDLEERRAKMVLSYENLMLSPEQTNSKVIKDKARLNFNVCSDTYYTTRAHIIDLIRITRGPTNNNDNSRLSLPSAMPQNFMNMSQNFNTDNAVCIKVPPCDTEVFRGGYEEWPSFRDMFTAVYINHPKLTRAQKLYHLRNKTKGDAGQIVKRYTLCDENFTLAWEALRSRYENKRVLVDKQLKILFNIPTAREETSESLQQIQATVNDCLSTFRTLNVRIADWDPILIYLVSTKLPDTTLSLWEQSLKSHRELPSWAEMDEFLINRYEVVERISTIRSIRDQQNHPSRSSYKAQPLKTQTYSSQENLKTLCVICESDHNIRICPEFRRFSVQERIDLIFKNKMCNNCLSHGHIKNNCKSKNTCMHCKKRHHSLLHLNSTESAPTTPSAQKTSDEQPGCSSNTKTKPKFNNTQRTHGQVQATFSSSNETILLRTALVDIEHKGDLFTVRALIDPGSQRTFVSERIRNILKLSTRNARYDIIGIGGQTQKSNKECDIEIYSARYGIRFSITAIVLPKLTKRLPAVSFSIQNPEEFQEIDLADPNFNTSSQIDLILGNDSERFINIDGIRKNISGTTSAYNTIFGWVLSGPIASAEIHSFTTNVTISEETEISTLLRKFWEQEEIPAFDSTSEEDKYCEEFYSKTTTRCSDGRYVVRLPFKKEFPYSISLGSSRFFALGQFSRMGKNLEKNNLKTTYNSVLNEYITLNHMEETDSLEIADGDRFHSFYLPHHAVVRPDHKTTKVRVVFNASRKSKSGFSLNDVLYTGPTLQTDLVSTILNWRLYKFVFSGDIQKMYRQIWVHPDDRCFQRILHQPDSKGPIKDYQLNTVTFGVNCAPFLAIRTLVQLASDVQSEHPRSSSILRNETYVDDILSGGYSISETRQAQTDLISVLKSAGFLLKKITANDPQLLSHLPPDDLYDSDFMRFPDTSSTKTLGIKWNALADTFMYQFDISPSENITKRKVLSIIAQLFDPAGWLTPIIIKAKIFIQQLWLEGTTWDESLSPESLAKWELIFSELPQIEQITIPRWIQFSPADTVYIYGFSDASKSAYCACVYIACQSSNFVKYCNLLVAKSKVAPLNTVCLPRLELNGALLLAKLVKYVNSIMKFNISETILWTDSSIVLGWLSKPPSSWETYVANRTSQIHTLIPHAKWKHVATHDNPADLGTRGCRPQDLINNTMWWHGPKWLTNPQSAWPISNPLAPPVPTLKTQTIHTTAEENDILNRFSSYPRALRVLSYIFRFFHKTHSNYRSNTSFPDVSISQNEISFVKTRLIRLAQESFYKEEYQALQNSEPISDKSALKPLNPVLDNENVLRVNGRLSDSSLPYNERYPIILPGNSRLSSLYLSYLHNFLVHAECNQMCRMVQTEFYISRLKPRIKAIIRKCKICVVFKQRPCSQLMAPLPLDRCTLSPPFHVTGIDFAGPFELKSSTLRNAPYIKGYVCVFVCFSTKAVHLEACSDLSSEKFQATFERFVGRRGLPRRVLSDNGRNFVGASRVLLKEFNKFLKSASSELSNKYATHGFEWNFIPPHAPHMGGLWEAVVKSFKFHFKRIACSHKYTYEEIATILTRIEGVLNSRPISAISENPTDLTALTPGHFLRGAPLMAMPEVRCSQLSATNRWIKLKAMYQELAIKWKEDYLKSLQKRYKWKNSAPNLKIGDLVVVIDDLLPPNEWRLGRIEKVHIGSDSKVRVADVRVSSGIITRPIVKLCYLPLQSEAESQ